jgi:hypothetical protein
VFKSQQREEIFFFFKTVHTGSGVKPASCSMGTAVRYQGYSDRDVKCTTTAAEVKNEWSYTSTPSIRLHGADRDNGRIE